jgi:outer membrane protein, heavy metal efflux system
MAKCWLSRSIAGLVGVCALVVLAAMANSALSSSPSPGLERPVPEDAPGRSGIKLDFRDLDEEELASIHERVEKPSAGDRLNIPSELPGANAPPLQMPRRDPAQPDAHEAALQTLYPPLPPVGDNLAPEMPVTGHPLTLGDLQRIARAESPVLHSAAATIRAAEGGVLQAGLLPNPVVGFAGDNINQNNSSGMLGGFVSQEFVLLCKIRMARAVAEADRDLADQTYRTIENEVVAGVRRGYFAVLAAQETMRIEEAHVRFADEVFRAQVDLVRGGQSAAYEPIQLRVLAYQARAQLVQARNRYIAAWKGLAVTVGRPQMPPMLLAGGIDQPMPLLHHEGLRAKILAGHSAIAAAHIALDKAQKELRLAETNRIPNVTVTGVVQHDDTMVVHNTTYNVAVGVPVPIFNRNQGNILRARAGVEKAAADARAVENELDVQLAHAFERYDNQRRLVVWYRDRILPDQMQAYRGVYGRHRIDPERVGFGEVVAAQQTLANATTTYLQTLGDAWDAVVELGKLAQAEDLFRIADETYSTTPCAGGSCAKHIADLVPWPDVMPTAAPISASASVPEATLPPGALIVTPLPQQSPQTPLAPLPASDCPCATPPEPTFLPAVGPVEKSTKRRWLLNWPVRMRETDPAPVMLPPTEESCCPPGVTRPMPMPMPTATAAPELLPTPGAPLTQVPTPVSMPVSIPTPARLPEVPAAPKASSGASPAPAVPLPQIFEGPSRIPTVPTPRPANEAGDYGNTTSSSKILRMGATPPPPLPVPAPPPPQLPLPPAPPPRSAPVTAAPTPVSSAPTPSTEQSPPTDPAPVRVPPLRIRPSID